MPRFLCVGLTVASLTAVAASAPGQSSGPAAPPAAKSSLLAPVRSVSRTPLPRGERLTVELGQEVVFTSERIPNPDRVYFDFKGTMLPATVAAAAPALGPGPLVASLRIAKHSEQVTRLVLVLGGQARYSAFVMYNPFRVVIDLETDVPAPPAPPPAARPVPVEPVPPRVPPAEPATTAVSEPAAATTPPTADTPPPAEPAPALADAVPAFKARAAADPPALSRAVLPPPPSPRPASSLPHGDYSLARQLGLGVARIVIDAGHGGHDPGAQSNGIVESELVLDVALRLERLLKDQPGVETVLTRRSDEFIPLEERTAIANRESADLFLSIHANASRQPAAHGLETYFLNFATNPEAEAVAARENATSGRTMGNLPELVKTITLNNKVVESRELATIVQTSMVRRLRLQNKAVRDLGVKQAPFVVLIGAQMPSVLAEISFITNRAEASLLKQPAYRQRIAQSLADAVVKYQGALKKTQTMAVKAQER